MIIDPRVREELLARFPTQEAAVNAYLRMLKNAPAPSQGDDFHGHHMLPRNWFPQYKDFRLHPWNCRNLFASDHSRAHHILKCIGSPERTPNRGKIYKYGKLQAIRLPDGDVQGLKRIATHNYESVSDVVRRAARELIAREERTKT